MKKAIKSIKDTYYHNSILHHSEVVIHDDSYASFEVWDDPTNGYENHEEGGVWLEDNKIVDYDGVVELPFGVKKTLKSIGYMFED